MLYREIIAVCSQIHTKHTNILYGQNVELLNVKPDGTYSDHWVLEGYRAYFLIAAVVPDYSYIEHKKVLSSFCRCLKEVSFKLANTNSISHLEVSQPRAT
jgi:hypothetical protein